MPEFLPDRLEAGTHNVPGAAGLLAGMRHVRRVGIGSIRPQEQQAKDRLAAQLKQIPGLRLYVGKQQTGVLSFVPQDAACVVLAEALGKHGIAVRAGLHCAPLAHETAGTLETGTLPVSYTHLITCLSTSKNEEVLSCLMF